MAKVFVDTNIWIYALDKHDRKKQHKTRTLLKALEENQETVISTQVVQEFYVAAVKKIGIDPLIAKGILNIFDNVEMVTVDSTLIKAAIDCHILNRLSFWDALIVSSAASANCETLWTEDLNHGQIINSVQIQNPYH